MAHPGDCAAQVTGQRLTSGSGPAVAPGRPPGLVVAAEVRGRGKACPEAGHRKSM